MPGDLGQIESGEMIMVVLIVTVLLFFGLFAYAQFQQDSVQQEERELEELNVLRTAQSAASLRDIACAYAEERDTACIDRVRIAIVNETRYSPPYFEERFGRSRLTVHQVYPRNATWTVYNGTLDDDATAVQIPVEIRDPLTRRTGFGYLEAVVS